MDNRNLSAHYRIPIYVFHLTGKGTGGHTLGNQGSG
jgi:hypothetical protein